MSLTYLILAVLYKLEDKQGGPMLSASLVPLAKPLPTKPGNGFHTCERHPMVLLRPWEEECFLCNPKRFEPKEKPAEEKPAV